MILGGGRSKIPRNRDPYPDWQMDCYLTLICVCAGHMSHIVKYRLLHHAKSRWWIEGFPDRSVQSRFHSHCAWAQCRFKLVLYSPLLTRDSLTTTYPQEDRCWVLLCWGEADTLFLVAELYQHSLAYWSHVQLNGDGQRRSPCRAGYPWQAVCSYYSSWGYCACLKIVTIAHCFAQRILEFICVAPWMYIRNK